MHFELIIESTVKGIAFATSYSERLFKDTKAHIIFTTHDISLMNRKQMRRDEIAFVEKNEKGESTVYTLADIKARSDASFSKDYMSGKYGAIPIINESCLDSRQVEGWLWAD